MAVVGIKGDGTRKLHLSDSPESSSLYLSGGDREIDVKCLTLEDIFRDNSIEYCDFMKIDCEGAEFKILLNTPESILKNIRKLHLEFHEFPETTNNHNDLIKILSDAGFKITTVSWHPHFGYIYGEKRLD